ncbi:MAG TPA: RNA methyltransferase [Vicinamibacterales bacterium]
MERIASRHNPIVKRFRELARAASADAMILDGEHLIEDALGAAVAIEVAAFAEAHASDRLASLVARTAASGARTITVPDEILAAMSPVKNPSGAVAIARCRTAPVAAILAAESPLILLLHGVQDPGNVGAVIRAAEACGATGVITGDGSADPFGWKALRGAMGSSFRMPIAVHQDLARVVTEARAAGIRIYAAAPRGGTPLASADLRRPSAVLLGGEGPGLPEALSNAADERLTIPMRPPVESLNVATAAAVVVYEAARQRSAR